MNKIFTKPRIISWLLIAILLLFSLGVRKAHAADPFKAAAGLYEVNATLSCYVSAMGGTEFGAPLLTGATLNVAQDGSRTVTLKLGKSGITIYGVTCDVFIDADPSTKSNDRGVMSGTIGYYDQSGTLKTDGVSHTISADTALNTVGDSVNYVDSITLPLEFTADKYNLTLFVNSNVMGVQFCNKNDEAETATYPAVLTIDWSGLPVADAQASETAPVSTASIENIKPESKAENTVSATVVEEEGINIHYAATSATPESKATYVDSRVIYTALVNEKALVIIAICASSLIVIGIGLLISSRKSKKEEDTQC